MTDGHVRSLAFIEIARRVRIACTSVEEKIATDVLFNSGWSVAVCCRTTTTRVRLLTPSWQLRLACVPTPAIVAVHAVSSVTPGLGVCPWRLWRLERGPPTQQRGGIFPTTC